VQATGLFLATGDDRIYAKLLRPNLTFGLIFSSEASNGRVISTVSEPTCWQFWRQFRWQDNGMGDHNLAEVHVCNIFDPYNFDSDDFDIAFRPETNNDFGRSGGVNSLLVRIFVYAYSLSVFRKTRNHIGSRTADIFFLVLSVDCSASTWCIFATDTR
jgi:hypothetical protein